MLALLHQAALAAALSASAVVFVRYLRTSFVVSDAAQREVLAAISGFLLGVCGFIFCDLARALGWIDRQTEQVLQILAAAVLVLGAWRVLGPGNRHV